MRPFLSVLADGSNLDGKARDLLDILERIRCLRYDSSNAFSEDLDSLYDQNLQIFRLEIVQKVVFFIFDKENVQ